MVTVLYIIWFLIPSLFFVIGLWSKLEQLSGKGRRENPGDFFRQGFFVLVCVLVCVGIDTYVLADIIDFLLPDILPLGFYQALLLPVVLYIAALIIGPSTPILISKAPRPTRRKPK